MLEKYFQKEIEAAASGKARIRLIPLLVKSFVFVCLIILITWIVTWPRSNYRAIPYGDSSGNVIIH